MKFYKDYFYSIRFFILFSILVFVSAAFLGYFSAKISTEEAKIILESLRQKYEEVFAMNSFSQFLFIFINNGFTLFLVLILGIAFGVFPFFVLFANGGLLGIVAYFFNDVFSWSKFFLGTTPHGIIEIPVLILSCAIGLKIGKTTYRRIFKKEGSVKSELALSFRVFLKVLLPLLAVAAAIEVFITAKILGL